MTFNIEVQVFEEFDGLTPEGWLRTVAERALAVGSAEGGAAVNVVVAGDEVVRDLNRTYRGLDENTDVLAFSFAHGGEYYGEAREASAPAEEVGFVLPPQETNTLGEVVISYPQARRQATAAGHDLDRELAVLLAHGVLHLLGHDHVKPREATVMRGLEMEVIEQATGLRS